MTGKYTIVYSTDALEDLRGIYSYIALEIMEPDIAKGQVDRIRKKIRSLEVFPKGYGRVDWEPWASMEMRKLPVDNYIVYFLVEDKSMEVIIIRVFYGGMDVRSIMNP